MLTYHHERCTDSILVFNTVSTVNIHSISEQVNKCMTNSSIKNTNVAIQKHLKFFY